MPAEKIVSQFNKTDIFAVFPTGLLIFLFSYVVYVTRSTPAMDAPSSFWVVLQRLVDQLQQKPVLLIYVGFAAYLLGSLVQTIPVGLAERLLQPFVLVFSRVRIFARKMLGRFGYHFTFNDHDPTELFPYTSVLHSVVTTLKEQAIATGIEPSRLPVLEALIPMHVFNYWKGTLCLITPPGFDYYQSFETRVRFFAGMIWAGYAGILAIFIMMIHSRMWMPPAGGALLLFSIILLSTFGGNFRRVRRQEARTLLLLYISLQQNTPATKSSEPITS